MCHIKSIDAGNTKQSSEPFGPSQGPAPRDASENVLHDGPTKKGRYVGNGLGRRW